MEFGFGLPTRGPMATPHSLATLAHKGEELGFAIISVSDHIIIPKDVASIYPYNESGSFAADPSGACLSRPPPASAATVSPCFMRPPAGT